MIFFALMVAELSFTWVVTEGLDVYVDVDVFVAFWEALSYLLADILQLVTHWIGQKAIHSYNFFFFLFDVKEISIQKQEKYKCCCEKKRIQKDSHKFHKFKVLLTDKTIVLKRIMVNLLYCLPIIEQKASELARPHVSLIVFYFVIFLLDLFNWVVIVLNELLHCDY